MSLLFILALHCKHVFLGLSCHEMAVAWYQEDFSFQCPISQSDAHLPDLLHHESECTFVLELVEHVDLILQYFPRKAAIEWSQICPFPLNLLLALLEVLLDSFKFFWFRG